MMIQSEPDVSAAREVESCIATGTPLRLGVTVQWSDDGQRISVTVLKVTPHQAAAWLAEHDNYRSLRPKRAERYMADMTADNWKLTGDPIRFVNGQLADGQHRLTGCVLTGKPFLTLVVHVDPEAQSVIDRGMPRRSADELKRVGIPHAAAAAAMAVNVLAFREGRLQDKASFTNATPTSVVEGFVIDNEASVHRATLVARDLYRELKLRPAAGGAIAFVLYEHDSENAARFLEALTTGANMDSDDPILVLRRWVTNKVLNKVVFSDEEFFGVTMKAWNAWRRGEAVKQLRFAPTGKGAARDKIPEPI